jgi:dihydropteroate synthase
MAREGAAIIDIGGESTRPGAQPVSAQEELDRVIPVVEALAGELEIPLSIDTSKPIVMREAVAAGAGMINDVLALQTTGALAVAAELQVPVCLMHMQGEPRTMQSAPHYRNLVAEVHEFLTTRIAVCRQAGIPLTRLLIDPGFGFGKTLAHNLRLLRHLADFQDLSVPILVGISRKSMIGSLLGGVPVEQRLYGSIAAATIAVLGGASLIRTHDVAATRQALLVAAAIAD